MVIDCIDIFKATVNVRVAVLKRTIDSSVTFTYTNFMLFTLTGREYSVILICS